MVRRQKSFWILVLLLLVGAVAGTVAGNALGTLVPAVSASVQVGLRPPVTLDLIFLTLTFGCGLALNVGSAVGLVAAALLYWRL